MVLAMMPLVVMKEILPLVNKLLFACQSMTSFSLQSFAV